MDKKRILIVSMAFSPDNSPRSFRTTELAKELGLQGHEVDVLTNKRDFNYSQFEMKYLCSVQPELLIKGYNPNVFSSRRNLLSRIIDRFLYQFFLYPDIEISWAIVSYLKNLNKSYDLLLSIAKPYAVHLGCAIALRKNINLAKKWIADCGDPFTLCKTDSYKFPFYFKWIEKFMFRQTSFITVPIDDMRSSFYPEFYSKIVTIPQGFRFEMPRENISYVKNRIPTFIYAGSVYFKIRDPRPLMDYLCSLPIEFKFVLYTGDYEVLKDYNIKSNGRIEVKNVIPRETLLNEMRQCDFLVNIDLAQNNTETIALPSKLIDYAFSGRPILNVYHNNLDYNVVNQFLKGDYSQKRCIDISNNNIESVVRKFLDLVNHIN